MDIPSEIFFHQTDQGYQILTFRKSPDDIPFVMVPDKKNARHEPPEESGQYWVSNDPTGRTFSPATYTKSNNLWGRGGFPDFPIWYSRIIPPRGCERILENRMYDTSPEARSTDN